MVTPPDSSGPSTGPSTDPSTLGSSPDTQPLGSQTAEEEEEEVNHDGPIPWGRLMIRTSLNRTDSVTIEDITEASYMIGRAKESDFVLEAGKIGLPQRLVLSCSKKHFRIYIERSGDDQFIFIEDFSSNGTLINGELIGKSCHSVLKSGDVISLITKDYPVFTFINLSVPEEDDDIPQKIKAKYQFIRDIGKGAMGLVKLCLSKTTRKRLACKLITKKSLHDPSAGNPDLMKEVIIIKKLDQPNIIKVEDVMETDDVLCIFMELVEAGDLFQLIKNNVLFEEKEAKHIFYQICLAVQYLHKNGVVHRDLKPENILLTSHIPEKRIVKVTDFGLSKLISSTSLLSTLCGTPSYIAPEVLASRGRGGYYTNAVDAWSLGVILFVCLTGQPPFTDQRQDMPFGEQILRGIYVLKEKYWEHIPLAKDLVQKLLTVDPNKRLTLDQVLEHPWLKDEELIQRVSALLSESSSDSGCGASERSDTPEPKRRRVDSEPNRSEESTPQLKKTMSGAVRSSRSNSGNTPMEVSTESTTMDTSNAQLQATNS